MERKKLKSCRRARGRAFSGAAWAILPVLVFSAYLMAVSNASPRLPWLGCVALLPLLRAIQVGRPGAALLQGALWGGCLYFFRVSADGTAIAPGFGAFALLTALPAAFAWLGCAYSRRFGFSPLAVGFGWMAVELALLPLGLRTGLLVGALGDGPLTHTLGHALGYVPLAFLVVVAGACVLCGVGRVRWVFVQLSVLTGWDVSSGWSWHLILRRFSGFHLSPCQPRAPPASSAVI